MCVGLEAATYGVPQTYRKYSEPRITLAQCMNLLLEAQSVIIREEEIINAAIDRAVYPTNQQTCRKTRVSSHDGSITINVEDAITEMIDNVASGFLQSENYALLLLNFHRIAPFLP
eukprot:TRINITY_DN9483_c0_g1_i4.p1 TRINITY_DN9483_c0_g1~~TRINITY_DN9483_c0_g1_i4.p1  ORF type:complete len:116 (-),score=6.66 TRINITY_DN9483_c0_g1_i4:193-540(-)